MTTLILERHAESMANLACVFAGQSYHDLTPKGRQQAELTACHIAAHYPIDMIIASDLSRTRQTAASVSKKTGLAVHTDPELREILAGDWEGVTFDRLAELYPEKYDRWVHDIGNAGCPGGESAADLSRRILAALTRIAEENDGKTVLVVTHATPIRSAVCAFRGKPVSEMKDIPWVSNASLTVVEYENGHWNLVKTDENEHLAELCTALPDNV